MTHKVSKLSCLKGGHTKGKILDRFSGPEYDDFDIERIDNIFLTANSFLVAKAVTEVVEEFIRAIIPSKDPSFMIEDYFGVEPGSLKISGVTELIFPKDQEQEDQIISMFKRFKARQTKANKILEKY